MIIQSVNAVFYTCIFIIPGFIIKEIIDSLAPPRKYQNSIYFLSCLMYSVVNCAIWSWLYVLINKLLGPSKVWYWILLILVTIVGASSVGLIVGSVKQNDSIRNVLRKFNINMSHSTPTSWDRVFSKQEPFWVIITLKDDSIIKGVFSDESFASSDIENQDIYLEKICDANDSAWINNERNRGILIQKDQIKTIEFIK